MSDCRPREKVADIYFVFQPIVYTVCGQGHTVDTYEVLLRTKGNDTFPSHVFVELLNDKSSTQLLFEQYSKMVDDFMVQEPHANLSINLRYQQMHHRTTWQFLESMSCYNKRIMIEFTETMPDYYTGDNTFILEGLKRVKTMGYKIAMDDVGTGMNTVQFVTDHLNYLSWIKLSVLPFRTMNRCDLLQFIQGWLEIAKENQIRLVVEAVEDEELAEALRQMGINYQQGYLWGRASGL